MNTRRIRPAALDAGEAVRPGRLGVSRNVVTLGVVSFFADISSEMLYPLIPLFLQTTLGAPVAAIGLIEGVAEATASITRILGGALADRTRRRIPFVFLGYATTAVGKVLLALSVVWPMALLARFVDRLGKGVRTGPRDALLADSARVQDRGRAFGFHRSMDTAGAVIGPLGAVGLLVAFHNHLRPIFWLALIPGVLSVLAVLPLREVRRESRSGERLRIGITGRQFAVFLGIFTLFAATNSSDVFLILRARSLGLSEALVVLAYVLYNVVYMILSLPAGIASDRIGRRNVLAVGLVLFAAVYVGFTVIRHSAWVWPLFLVYGGYIALTDGVAKALISDLVPAETRATAIGTFAAATGISALIASVTAGILWQVVGAWAPFAMGAAGAGLAAVLLITLLPARVAHQAA